MYDIIAKVKVEKNDRYNVYNIITGLKISDKISYELRKKCIDSKGYLAKVSNKWEFISEVPSGIKILGDNMSSSTKMTDDEIRESIQNSYSLKPETLVLDKLNWKFAVRAVLRGENILLLGHSGCGKTLTARELAKALKRPFKKFNMGAMTDARSSLIGNTHYDNSKGTYFAGSKFIKAITTPNTIILLDELTRISPDAENILMTVLDMDQRYMRIDEDPNTPIIKVANGVTFIGTANVGVEYTSTRILDRATKDRFSTIVELPLLTKKEEVNLMKLLFPEINLNYITAIAEIADYTRKNVHSDNPTLDTLISTRSTVKQCELAMDGFIYSEIMEAMVVPMFSSDGGADSNRSEIKQFIQKNSHLDNDSPLKKFMKKETPDVMDDDSGIVTDKFNEDDDLFDINNDTF